jgi:hypothetical protein
MGRGDLTSRELTGTVTATAQIFKPAEKDEDDDSPFIYLNDYTKLGSMCSALTDPCAFCFNTK